MGCTDIVRRERRSRRPGFRPRRPADRAAPSPPSSSWRMACEAAGLLVVVAGLLAAPTAAQAQTLSTMVTNLYTAGLGLGFNYRAQRFITGDKPGGYTLSEIDIPLTTATGRSMTVKVRKNANGSPDETADGLVVTLRNLTPLTSNAVNTFMAPAGTILKPRTTYWISVHEGIAPVDSQGAVFEVISSDSDN